MTIWGAFTNSIEAIQAQSDAMDVISQNIANVNTVGYKNSVDNFQTVLSTETANTNIFGVQVVRQYNNDVQGAPISTGLWDNLAINGQGFFILNSATNGTGSTSYTRAGNFAEAVLPSSTSTANSLANPASSDTAYLTDGQGDYLMGWKATGGVANTTNSLSGLTAVNFAMGSILPGQATTAVTLQGSIPSNAPNTSTPACSSRSKPTSPPPTPPPRRATSRPPPRSTRPAPCRSNWARSTLPPGPSRDRAAR